MKFKELLQIASSELDELIDSTNADLRLEQVEFNADKKIWEIVVSYLIENINRSTMQSALSSLGALPYQRIYKKFEINEEKEVLSMKIFNP